MSLFTKLGARYYNPSTGRFTQPDPSHQETNNYAYASADPANNTDPTGLFSFDNLVNDVVGVATSIVVSDVCEDATDGFGTVGCAIVGGVAGVIVTEELNSYDENNDVHYLGFG